MKHSTGENYEGGENHVQGVPTSHKRCPALVPQHWHVGGSVQHLCSWHTTQTGNFTL